MDRGWRTGERADCSKHRSYGLETTQGALAMAKGADAFILCSLGEAIAMSLIENMYIKEADFGKQQQ